MDATRLRVCNARDFARAKYVDDVGHQWSWANVGCDMVLRIRHILTPRDVVDIEFATIGEGYVSPQSVALSKHFDDSCGSNTRRWRIHSPPNG